MIITTKKDLRNYVDSHTDSWDKRSDDELNDMVDMILEFDHPPYGQDWKEFLDSSDVSDVFYCGYTSNYLESSRRGLRK